MVANKVSTNKTPDIKTTVVVAEVVSAGELDKSSVDVCLDTEAF